LAFALLCRWILFTIALLTLAYFQRTASASESSTAHSGPVHASPGVVVECPADKVAAVANVLCRYILEEALAAEFIQHLLRLASCFWGISALVPSIPVAFHIKVPDILLRQIPTLTQSLCFPRFDLRLVTYLTNSRLGSLQVAMSDDLLSGLLQIVASQIADETDFRALIPQLADFPEPVKLNIDSLTLAWPEPSQAVLSARNVEVTLPLPH